MWQCGKKKERKRKRGGKKMQSIIHHEVHMTNDKDANDVKSV